MRKLPRKILTKIQLKITKLAENGFGPARYISRLSGKDILEIGTIADHAKSSFCVAQPSIQIRIAPNFSTNKMSTVASAHPALFGHILRNAVVSTNSNQIQTRDMLLMPQQRYNERLRIMPNCHELGTYNDRFCTCNIRNHERFEKAIFLGGDGVSNWYHFVLECASKAYLLRLIPKEYLDYPVIMPIEAMTVEPYIKVARALLPNKVFLSPKQGTAQIGKLVVFDEVSQGPFNLYDGHWPKLADYWQHEDILLGMFSQLRDSLVPTRAPISQSRRIFIVRPETRRNYNQSELLEIARLYGFEPVSPETMPLEAQALMYAEASHIIGASGAAWTNLIFSPKPVTALSWLPTQYSEFCSFSMLANLLGHHLRYITCLPEGDLKSTSEAYSAPYKVPLSEFEAAVAHMCGE